MPAVVPATTRQRANVPGVRIVVRDGGGETDLDVELRAPGAVLADLAHACGLTPGQLLHVDGRPVPGDRPVADAGLVEGGTLEVGGGFVARAPAGAYELVVLAGPDAGAAAPLLGRVLVGRGPAAGLVLTDPAVSREHCVVELGEPGLSVTDLGARNGLAVDGAQDRAQVGAQLAPGATVTVGVGATLRLGASLLQVRAHHEADRAPIGSSFNRPPRGAPPTVSGPLPLPEQPRETVAEPFGVAALVGPLLLAVVLVAITGDARFAVFSALTPLLAVGTWYESRRRGRRRDRRAAASYRAELAELAVRVEAAADRERDRLREVAPDLPEVLRRAALPSTRLWERRPGDPDLLRLQAGTADQAWRPPVPDHVRPPPEVEQVLAGGRLRAAPVVVDLASGGVVGLVGDRETALAAARGLLCSAAVGQGPADLTIAVFVDPERAPAWQWCGWLPHTRDAGGRRWLADDPADAAALLRLLADGSASGTLLLVLDTAVLTTGRSSAARELLARAREGSLPVAGLVLAPSADVLPAACDQVLSARADGTGSLLRLGDGARVDDVLIGALSVARARRCARHLARLEDPELQVPGAGLPASVRLLPLLGLVTGELGTGTTGTGEIGTGEIGTGEIDADAVRRRWRAAGSDPGARTPIGRTATGVFELDLVRDGAHGLVGGTTGSGKSELLRSLVAGLAVSADAAHLTFVLVDYKGGAAFDVCARLPHVVGLVTDLDEQLGERALRALEAELHHRERTLRAAGADSLPAYLALGRAEPLPRLVVVIDEFATLTAELPDFVTSLVGIAQRGRTLGVHLLLATQRPSGAVNDNIKANTNLRIALRVQDDADSRDVLGTPAAAALSRDTPGRAYARLGPGEVVALQTALVSGRGAAGDDGPVRVRPVTFGPGGRVDPGPAPADGRTDLARLVDAVVEAHAREGLAPPRRPWPEPLPPALDLADLLERTDGPPGVAPVALADDPAAQVQRAAGWDLSEGGLLLFGVPGSGSAPALVALGTALAAGCSPADLHLYGLDFGAGELAELAALPHTGAVVPAADRERQVRLLHRLRAELDRRRQSRDDGGPRIVLLVDNLGALRAAYDDADGLELQELLARLHADGPASGIVVAITADRPSAVPGPIAAVTTQKWLFRLADPADHLAAGLTRTQVPAPVRGRAVLLPSGLQAQLGRASPDLLARIADRWAGVEPGATPVGVLPARVAVAGLPAAGYDGESWRVPVGIRSVDLGVAELVLYEGDAVLIAGPARSGKTSVLAGLAAVLRAGGAHVVATSGRRSALARCPGVHEWWPSGGLPAGLAAPARPTFLLVDDADGDDVGGRLEALVQGPVPGLTVIAAGRSEALRGLYGHWTGRVRRSRTGLLLNPAVDVDGDLLGVVLPRRAAVAPGVARGYLVSGGALALVQAATDGPAPATGSSCRGSAAHGDGQGLPERG